MKKKKSTKKINKSPKLIEELNPRKLASLSFWIWVGSIVIFFLLVFYAATHQTTPNPDKTEPLGYLLIGVVVLGILAFLGMVIFKAWEEGKLKLLGVIAAFLVLVIGGGLVSAYYDAKVTTKLQNDAAELVVPTPTVVPTTTSTPTLTKPRVVSDPDPVVNCESSAASCKGSTIKLKRSQCQNITCCQIGSTWSVYPSREKCVEAQKANQGTHTPPTSIPAQTAPASNKVPVFLTYSQYTVYCPAQNVDAVKSIDATMTSKKTEWAKNYNECADYFYSSDSCFVNCKKINNTELDTCVAAYGYSGENYRACTDEAFDNYSICIGGCPSAYKACDYVYAEQKSMSAQINNLCK